MTVLHDATMRLYDKPIMHKISMEVSESLMEWEWYEVTFAVAFE